MTRNLTSITRTVVGVALSCGLVASFLVFSSDDATATSTLTLFVVANAPGITCLDDGVNACSSIGDAVAIADVQTNTAVTVHIAPGTYTENDTIDLPSNDSLTLQGAGAATTVVDANSAGNDFGITGSGAVTLDGLTIENGVAQGASGGNTANGGAIDNADGDLTLTNDVFNNDAATGGTGNLFDSGGDAYGGAIYDANGDLAVTNDSFTHDAATGGNGGTGGGNGGNAYGGALFMQAGTLTMTNATFSSDSSFGGNGTHASTAGNGGDGDGGALYTGAVSSTLTSVTFSSDTASGGGTAVGAQGGNGGNGYGGALYSVGAAASLSNTTFWSNSALATNGGVGTSGGAGGNAYGGAIYNLSPSLTLVDNTIADNVISAGTGGQSGGAAGSAYGAGIDNAGGTTITNSILDQADSCYGGARINLYDVESDTSCGFADQNATIDLASSLGANGSSGPETLAIGSNSGAFEEVPIAECLSTDERGDPRPGVGSSFCDAGAYEYQGTVTYDLETGDGIPVDANVYLLGMTVNVLFSPSPTLAGYNFAGWCDVATTPGTTCSGDVYAQTGTTSFTMPAGDVTLYALWNTRVHVGTTTTTTVPTDTLTFASDGGSPVASETGLGGSSVALPAAPSYAGYVFDGWYTQPSAGALAGLGGASYVVNGSLTLYAQWTKSVPSSVGFTIVVGTIGFFSTGSATFTPGLIDELTVLVSRLRSPHVSSIELVGAAPRPNDAQEVRLAQARALAVENYLRAHGFSHVTFVLKYQVAGTSATNSRVTVLKE